ncbi:hypothetical protein Slin14017_G128460 [Septoria linicola]|nr:hypothetical protein Slin14017_G128460 [Septoria linicola]
MAVDASDLGAPVALEASKVVLETNGDMFEDELAGLLEGVNARCNTLQKQHNNALQSLWVDKKALRDSLDHPTEKYKNMSEANSRLKATYAKLSARLTSIQGGLGAIRQMETELGEFVAPILLSDLHRRLIT